MYCNNIIKHLSIFFKLLSLVKHRTITIASSSTPFGGASSPTGGSRISRSGANFGVIIQTQAE